ncbi:MAG TPA: sigma 54-interacting transcriptional regulator [Candidatus Saccharimonadales bacterium]|nr:sigma 54-interacting transcriptional regulator [Candidatus Saccharimonadales bacterium]
MEAGEVWICHEDSGRLGIEEALRQRMSSAGLTLHAGPIPRSASGIVVIEQVDDGLCDRIGRWTDRGSSRLLILANRRSALPGDATWRLVRAGASEVLALEDLDDPLEVITRRIRRWIDIDQAVDSPEVSGRLIGSSRVWRAALRQVVELGLFTESPILVTGESGTGKELAAHLLHDLGGRREKGQLVLVDCTTIVPDLSASEFFGHERGAFTGALTARDGLFAKADGGTLFLDEVGELPMRLQAELLRVVQEGTYRRVGSNQWRKTSFRLICATNRDLEASRAQGSFRDDFYHRLAGGICRLPSLEERREDIPLLTGVFLGHILGKEPPALDPSVREFLMGRSYPGNVRELRQLVARMAARYVAPGPLTIASIPEAEREAGNWTWRKAGQELESAVRLALSRGHGLEEIRQAVAGIAYRTVLDEEGGSTVLAAKRLKVSARAVQLHVRNGTPGPDALGESKSVAARSGVSGAPGVPPPS